MTQRDAFHELCAYTVTHRDPSFIHQHVVDAFAAQIADEHTKPITLTFALLGLYLHVERHFTGKRVQQAHQYLARRKRSWPSFALPHERGSMTALEVLAQPAGVARDEAIHAWCASVWDAFCDVQHLVAELWSLGQAKQLPTLPTFFETPAKFRAWLKRHSSKETEIVVGFYERGSGRPSMSWSESVDEALRYGWIDGVRTRIDEHSYKIRFSPRKSASTWSSVNIEKVKVLQATGRMTQAGLDAFARRNKEKSRTYSYEQAKRAELEPRQMAELQRNKKAWKFFEAQPPSYRHMAAWYVISAKRPETRSARLAKVIEVSARGLRL